MISELARKLFHGQPRCRRMDRQATLLTRRKMIDVEEVSLVIVQLEDKEMFERFFANIRQHCLIFGSHRYLQRRSKSANATIKDEFLGLRSRVGCRERTGP